MLRSTLEELEGVARVSGAPTADQSQKLHDLMASSEVWDPVSLSLRVARLVLRLPPSRALHLHTIMMLGHAPHPSTESSRTLHLTLLQSLCRPYALASDTPAAELVLHLVAHFRLCPAPSDVAVARAAALSSLLDFSLLSRALVSSLRSHTPFTRLTHHESLVGALPSLTRALRALPESVTRTLCSSIWEVFIALLALLDTDCAVTSVQELEPEVFARVLDCVYRTLEVDVTGDLGQCLDSLFGFTEAVCVSPFYSSVSASLTRLYLALLSSHSAAVSLTHLPAQDPAHWTLCKPVLMSIMGAFARQPHGATAIRYHEVVDLATALSRLSCSCSSSAASASDALVSMARSSFEAPDPIPLILTALGRLVAGDTLRHSSDVEQRVYVSAMHLLAWQYERQVGSVPTRGLLHEAGHPSVSELVFQEIDRVQHVYDWPLKRRLDGLRALFRTLRAVFLCPTEPPCRVGPLLHLARTFRRDSEAAQGEYHVTVLVLEVLAAVLSSGGGAALSEHSAQALVAYLVDEVWAPCPGWRAASSYYTDVLPVERAATGALRAALECASTRARVLAVFSDTPELAARLMEPLGTLPSLAADTLADHERPVLALVTESLHCLQALGRSSAAAFTRLVQTHEVLRTLLRPFAASGPARSVLGLVLEHVADAILAQDLVFADLRGFHLLKDLLRSSPRALAGLSEPVLRVARATLRASDRSGWAALRAPALFLVYRAPCSASALALVTTAYTHDPSGYLDANLDGDWWTAVLAADLSAASTSVLGAKLASRPADPRFAEALLAWFRAEDPLDRLETDPCSVRVVAAAVDAVADLGADLRAELEAGLGPQGNAYAVALAAARALAGTPDPSGAAHLLGLLQLVQAALAHRVLLLSAEDRGLGLKTLSGVLWTRLGLCAEFASSASSSPSTEQYSREAQILLRALQALQEMLAPARTVLDTGLLVDACTRLILTESGMGEDLVAAAVRVLSGALLRADYRNEGLGYAGPVDASTERRLGDLVRWLLRYLETARPAACIAGPARSLLAGLPRLEGGPELLASVSGPQRLARLAAPDSPEVLGLFTHLATYFGNAARSGSELPSGTLAPLEGFARQLHGFLRDHAARLTQGLLLQTKDLSIHLSVEGLGLARRLSALLLAVRRSGLASRVLGFDALLREYYDTVRDQVVLLLQLLKDARRLHQVAVSSLSVARVSEVSTQEAPSTARKPKRKHDFVSSPVPLKRASTTATFIGEALAASRAPSPALLGGSFLTQWLAASPPAATEHLTLLKDVEIEMHAALVPALTLLESLTPFITGTDTRVMFRALGDGATVSLLVESVDQLVGVCNALGPRDHEESGPHRAHVLVVIDLLTSLALMYGRLFMSSGAVPPESLGTFADIFANLQRWYAKLDREDQALDRELAVVSKTLAGQSLEALQQVRRRDLRISPDSLRD